jgi:lipoate---protein ligase
MILIDNENNTHPAINLALEEYALTQLDLDVDHILFYVNKPSVIIGKHQNTHEEINRQHIDTQGIHVVRRISGGGTVYHDQGNLNFSFLTRSAGKTFNDYRTFTQPIIQALHALGVPAELTGRNDIIANGKKISGNAQYRRAKKMFCHGTLLFDSNLDQVVSALNVKADKIQSKGIKSVRSRVTNIRELLKQDMTIDQFKQHLLDHLFKTQTLRVHQFSPTDWQAIKALAQSKYETWGWNYGKSPQFDVQHRERLPIGEIDIRMNIKHSAIAAIKIYGDFFAERDIAELEALLLGQPYDQEALRKHLQHTDLNLYFSKLTVDEFLSVIF